MPEYVVLYIEKRSKGKPKSETVFAPSNSEAWEQAAKIIPKGSKIVDILREDNMKRKYKDEI